jgi:release factor glutamine methyltransferase
MMTVLEVLNAATSYLQKQGVESPRLNAEHLLAHALGKSKRMELYLEFDRPLGEGDRAPLRDLVKRRAEGVPLQHLLGSVEFCGHTFACDARALIPRPETEQLVELVLKEGMEEGAYLDVGTGSGVIALSIALAFPKASVTACDISDDALALAAANRKRHSLDERVVLCQSDLLSNIAGRFDVMVANLPYIPTGDVGSLSKEVLKDPLLALDGGGDGLQLVERLASDAKAALSSGGLLALEIGHDQAERVIRILEGLGYHSPVSFCDYQNVQRFVLGRLR